MTDERFDYGGVYEGDDDDDDGYNYPYYDDGSIDDDDETQECPHCHSVDTLHETTNIAYCYQDIGDPNEQGIRITVENWYCYDCDKGWLVQHGRPLNVDCDCD